MNQKKPAKRSGRQSLGTRDTEVNETSQRHAERVDLPETGTPPNAVRNWLSIWVFFHLAALFVSFTSVVEPSRLHARLSQVVHLYLRAGHFAADDRPVYLAHGTESEQPHRLQVTSDVLVDIDQTERCRWRSVGSGDYTIDEPSPGSAVGDRVGRWLATAATLAENDQPGVVAELLVPLAQHFTDASAIRIIRFPTDLNDINAVPSSPYVAKIVRSADSVSLVRLNQKRLSSEAIATGVEGSR